MNGAVPIKETEIDLLHDTIISLSLKRMDSLMVPSNIKRMSRLELLYICAANLAKETTAREEELSEGLAHYT